MVEFTREHVTEGIPLGTPISELRGQQCFISAFRVGLMHRCMRVAEAVMVVQCEACKQGGMMPVCKPHGKQLSERASIKDASCPQCGKSSMNQTEPVEFPQPKQQVAVPKHAPLDDNYGEMYW